jgi:hypothetical protein
VERRGARALALLLALAGASMARAEIVALAPRKDNTLCESATGALSNGRGQHFFAGRNNAGERRRAVLAFDIAGSVPAGSTITAVSLTLHMSRTIALEKAVSLHPLKADWGEGGSDATLNEGGCAAAAAGDATWIHRFAPSTLWEAPGGDFFSAPSATLNVGGVGSYTWASTPALVADVQEWLDEPAANFGWALIGDETSIGTAKRFDSRENATVSLRPLLRVEFTPPVSASGQVPDGRSVPGGPLAVVRLTDGSLRLSWGGSCLSTDTDYEVYEVRLGAFTTHAPRLCTTGGQTTATLSPDAGSTYYLVVPRNSAEEGSYGVNHLGLQRSPSLSACLPQAVPVCR